MLKKIFEAGTINLLNSFLSFIITMIIVNKIGLDRVGELYILLAFCSLVMLLNILLPPTYSLVKLQNSQLFAKYFFGMYFYVQFIIFLVGTFLFYSTHLNWSWVIALYCCASSWLNFYDVILQSKGLIKNFYLCTILGSLTKVMLLLAFSTSSTTIIELVGYFLVGQIVSLISMFYINKVKGRIIVFNFNLLSLIAYYLRYFKSLQSFYVSTIFKRLFDNFPAIIFGSTVPANVLGVFSIFQKCLIFGVSFIRVVESFLLTRNYSILISKKVKSFTVLASVAFTFVASILYGAFTTGIMIQYSILISFLIIPIFISIEIRAKYIKAFSLTQVNLAMLASILVLYLSSNVECIGELNKIFISYSLMLITQSIWLWLAFNYKKKT